jgi:hypothetical protein
MTTKKLTEVEAVNVIHKALEPFDVPGRTKVLRAVVALLEVEPLNGASGAAAGNLAATGAPAANLNNARIDVFVSTKKPTTTYQRIACLAYYLEHHDQLIELTSKDLSKANAAARQPKISNVGVFLNDATAKYGFFAAVGGGKKSLTQRGSAVVEALPDQAAVKQVLQDIPAPRQSGKRSKAKVK